MPAPLHSVKVSAPEGPPLDFVGAGIEKETRGERREECGLWEGLWSGRMYAE